MTTTEIALRDAPSRSLPAAAAASAAPQSFLSFRLGAEEYALPLLAVQEIRSAEAPTRTPGAAGALLGIVQLREAVLPVYDLRLFMNLPVPAKDTQSVFIVLRTPGEQGLALQVDAVSDVQHLGAEQLRPMPALAAMTAQARAGLMQAVASVEERMLIILDAQALLAALRPN